MYYSHSLTAMTVPTATAAFPVFLNCSGVSQEYPINAFTPVQYALDTHSNEYMQVIQIRFWLHLLKKQLLKLYNAICQIKTQPLWGYYLLGHGFQERVTWP